MSQESYKWKRYWYSQSKDTRLYLSKLGYLPDQNVNTGVPFTAYDFVPFELINPIPCLVLLGEPGMGKTETLNSEQLLIKSQIEKNGDSSLWCNLRSFRDSYKIDKDIFDSPTFNEWLKGNHSLYLFLDSLDECLLKLDTICDLLIEKFETHKRDINRLYLRIVCRTAVWPFTFEAKLKDLWGNNAIEVYELAPLQRKDVKEAAIKNSIASPDKLLKEIEEKRLIPLARKPVTLKFLLKQAFENQHLSSTQAELYSKGCLWLCEEMNQSRQEKKLTGDFSPEYRLAVATRIAAITIFSNRYTIWVGSELEDIQDEDIRIRELIGGVELLNGEKYLINEAAIKDAINNTSLFSYRGIDRRGWEHQTYAEFLAAKFLLQNEMSLKQIMSLLTSSDGRIIPQLYETAAWIAIMNPSVFQEVIKIDPEILFISDVSSVAPKDRAVLVEGLLNLYDSERAMPPLLSKRPYEYLDHPGLTEQLRSYLINKNKNHVVRDTTIDIADACKVKELQNELLAIALEPSEFITLRVKAIRCLHNIGSSSVIENLKPLAINLLADDQHDDLKGSALQAIWPDYLKAEELFSALTLPKSTLYFGGPYHKFLSEDLVFKLLDEDLPIALRWVEIQPNGDDLPNEYSSLVYLILKRAWEKLDIAEIFEPFIQALFSRLQKDEGSKISYLLEEDTEKRHKVLSKLIDLLSGDINIPSFRMRYSGSDLVSSVDLIWWLEQLQIPISDKAEYLIVEWIYSVFIYLWRTNTLNIQQVDAIIVTSKINKTVAKEFGWVVNPIELNSPEAEKAKAQLFQQQQPKQKVKSHPLIAPVTAIDNWLDRFESGDLLAWCHIVNHLTLDPNINKSRYILDLTVLPGWSLISNLTKERILKAAREYVLKQDRDTEEWLGKNISAFSVIDGYKALYLLMLLDAQFLSTIPSCIWKKWLPIIIDYRSDVEDLLLKLVYKDFPSEVIECLMFIIDKTGWFYTNKFNDLYDDRLAHALFGKLTDTSLSPSSMGILLTFLIQHNHTNAINFAVSLVLSAPNCRDEERSKAVIAASKLILYTQNSSLTLVCSIIKQDTEFGKEVISSMLNTVDRDVFNLIKFLKEDQLADLYIWLVQQYPHQEDPIHNGAFIVTNRDSIAQLRDSTLSQLGSRTNDEAIKAMGRISIQVPKVHWLVKPLLLEIQNRMRREWKPLSSKNIFKLANDKQSRIIQNSDDLLELIIESLQRLEGQFQGINGTIPSAIDLWNEVSISSLKSVLIDLLTNLGTEYVVKVPISQELSHIINRFLYTPKDENRLSDYIKSFLDIDLKQRGLLVNREVEIRRDDITDIKVDTFESASNHEEKNPITVIIEVKGCWNDELHSAMKTQLLDRYLYKSPYNGLYVVGWYNCEKWDNSDYRKREAKRLVGDNIESVQETLNQQALTLSQSGLNIRAMVLNISLPNTQTDSTKKAKIHKTKKGIASTPNGSTPSKPKSRKKV